LSEQLYVCALEEHVNVFYLILAEAVVQMLGKPLRPIVSEEGQRLPTMAQMHM
jgi:hypothetical protein